jgi:hypothetical protein
VGGAAVGGVKDATQHLLRSIPILRSRVRHGNNGPEVTDGNFSTRLQGPAASEQSTGITRCDFASTAVVLDFTLTSSQGISDLWQYTRSPHIDAASRTKRRSRMSLLKKGCFGGVSLFALRQGLTAGSFHDAVQPNLGRVLGVFVGQLIKRICIMAPDPGENNFQPASTGGVDFSGVPLRALLIRFPSPVRPLPHALVIVSDLYALITVFFRPGYGDEGG